MSGEQARGLGPLPGAEDRPLLPGAVAVVSGKGGVGKTNLVANLAVAAAGLRARVLVVDGDLGLANVDVLLGLVPPHTVEDVLAGRCALADAIVAGPRGVRLLPAAAGRAHLAGLGTPGLAPLLAALRPEAAAHDLVLVDAGAGVGPSVVGLAAACERIWLVSNEEPTSLADAYATLKVLRGAGLAPRTALVVNEARDERTARGVHQQLRRLSQRFLGLALEYAGALPRDPRLEQAVARQRAVVELYPAAPSSRRFVALAQTLLAEARSRRDGAAPPGDRPASGTARATSTPAAEATP